MDVNSSDQTNQNQNLPQFVFGGKEISPVSMLGYGSVLIIGIGYVCYIAYKRGEHSQEDRYRDKIDDFKHRITNLERDSKSK